MSPAKYRAGNVGLVVGCGFVGGLVGFAVVGMFVDMRVGVVEGNFVGGAVGLFVGWFVGNDVGLFVGCICIKGRSIISCYGQQFRQLMHYETYN